MIARVAAQSLTYLRHFRAPLVLLISLAFYDWMMAVTVFLCSTRAKLCSNTTSTTRNPPSGTATIRTAAATSALFRTVSMLLLILLPLTYSENKFSNILCNNDDCRAFEAQLNASAAPLDTEWARRRQLQITTTSDVNFQLNTVTDDSRYPSVAGLSDGGFVVTWYTQVTPYKVWGQRYSSTGAANGVNFQVSTVTDSSRDPSVAGLSDGGFVVTWYSQVSPFKVWGQRYSSSGAANGVNFQVNTVTDSSASPSVAGLSDGGFVVTWYTQGSPYKVWGQRYSSSSGAANGVNFQVNTITDSSLHR
jgi:hypothetical protein